MQYSFFVSASKPLSLYIQLTVAQLSILCIIPCMDERYYFHILLPGYYILPPLDNTLPPVEEAVYYPMELGISTRDIGSIFPCIILRRRKSSYTQTESNISPIQYYRHSFPRVSSMDNNKCKLEMVSKLLCFRIIFLYTSIV